MKRRIYERRQPGSRTWEQIDDPLPSSLVGHNLTEPGKVWEDSYGWAYRYREVDDD